MPALERTSITHRFKSLGVMSRNVGGAQDDVRHVEDSWKNEKIVQVEINLTNALFTWGGNNKE